MGESILEVPTVDTPKPELLNHLHPAVNVPEIDTSISFKRKKILNLSRQEIENILHPFFKKFRKRLRNRTIGLSQYRLLRQSPLKKRHQFF